MKSDQQPQLNQKEQVPVRILIKESIKETCLDTTLHGIPHILAQTKHIILKIFWVLATLTSVGACLYFVIKSIRSFLEYSAFMSVDTYNEVPSLFPMVSFCNLNKFNYASSLVKTYLANYVSEIYPPFSIFNSVYEWNLVASILTRSQINQDPHNLITDSNRKLYGMQIEDMLISCYFNFQPCNVSDFTYFYHTEYGNCYTFNGLVNSTKVVNSNNQLYGLVLELYLGDPYIVLPSQTNQGILLSIQNQTSQPFWQDNVYKIDGARETDIILKRSLVTLLTKPYGNCSDGSGTNSYYYNYVVNTLGFTYSSEICTKVCLQSNIVKECNCIMTFFPANELNYSYCNATQQRNCAQGIVTRSSITNACNEACPSECSYTQYDVTTSRANYPTYGYNGILDDTVLSYMGIKQSVNYTAESYAKINIYYQELVYTKIVQTAQEEIQDIISNLGGTVGLCLGFSFLTLGEIIQIIFEITLILVTYLVNKRGSRQVALNIVNEQIIGTKQDVSAFVMNEKKASIIEEKISMD